MGHSSKQKRNRDKSPGKLKHKQQRNEFKNHDKTSNQKIIGAEFHQNHNQYFQNQRQLKEKKLSLSHELRQFSSQKRLKECLSLYHSPKNDALRDVHHGSIVVDCCARCGDVEGAEGVVEGMMKNILAQQLMSKHKSKKARNEKSDSYSHENESRAISNRFFWGIYQPYVCKKIPIQAWTALLKGYVHSGMMYKADPLFCHLCAIYAKDSSAISSVGVEGVMGKSRKRKLEGSTKADFENAPNVRTLNTLLRGCLWTATSLDGCDEMDNSGKSNDSTCLDSEKLVGGVVTAEKAWELCCANGSKHNHASDGAISSTKGPPIECDSSSYEYSISLLSQSLRCKDAEQRLEEMKTNFGIPKSLGRDFDGDLSVDPSILESFVVSLVAISRGYALTGKLKEGGKYAQEAVNVIAYMEQLGSSSTNSFENSSPTTTSKSGKAVRGGKQAWRSNKDRKDNGFSNNLADNSRREESNVLFRTHRLSELRLEALSLAKFCTKESNEKDAITQNAKMVARWMMSRLLYFSGGGTTGLDINPNANEVFPSTTSKDDERQILYTRLINSSWNSFGLKETVGRLFKKDNFDFANAIFPVSASKKQSKKTKKHNLPLHLDVNSSNKLWAHVVGEQNHIITSDGFIDFSKVFSSLEDSTGTSSASGGKMKVPPLHIELGAGSGDWISLQALLNPSDNYVTVELRADRVAQTFTKCILHQNEEETSKNIRKEFSKSSPLTNVCCVGSECGSFLRKHVSPGSVRTIFVNHPEPPTQTFELQWQSGDGNRYMGGIVEENADSSSTEEPAHMLNSQTLITAAKCLEPNGDGRLIIVTDNLIYARLICRTLAMDGVLASANLLTVTPGEVHDLRNVESFDVRENKGSRSIHLYEGKPSLTIGHFVPTGANASSGTSYFDRLWRTGAGKHAQMKKRFIIALRTRGGSTDFSIPNDKSKLSMNKNRKLEMKSPNTTTSGQSKHNHRDKNEGGKKQNKKRSAEKQRLRNERRLLKKQLQQAEGASNL